ncbi:zinc finger CCCH domain-containing protein 3 [Conger conger]|uniref:zinc finger CCCH domain-containing protein 3 n=1 Tax=Conger conger TaxID=82655 RepID=UPI002A5A5A0D|nr:zinc finger CCCH domain-containing protein 3 [Conger conger]
MYAAWEACGVQLCGTAARRRHTDLAGFSGAHGPRRTLATLKGVNRVRFGSSSSVRSGGVIRTRYKITRRTGPAPNPTLSPAPNASLSPALTWRAKRLQSARALLLTRQAWRGRGMRWIGGALYRVSANKLCRTAPSSSAGSAPTPRQRTGKWSGPADGVWAPGRAVQRSLAIVRQARQRRQQGRQYCMYYNRFGRCNRGSACPYIHDPDKVAVCTRFLRGTCKQTDGSCPFSHKVSKEKMPVCSYFLRGICSNSSCPYSHVYVSRSAAVCQDFVRGYCPKGEKCKQKHTLLCPDFSSSGVCPRGSQCKLQHRQRPKRSRPSPTTSTPKRPRGPEPPPRSEGAESAGEAPPSSGHETLPSFISLPSSPQREEGPARARPPGARGPREATPDQTTLLRALEPPPLRNPGAAQVLPGCGLLLNTART